MTKNIERRVQKLEVENEPRKGSRIVAILNAGRTGTLGPRTSLEQLQHLAARPSSQADHDFYQRLVRARRRVGEGRKA